MPATPSLRTPHWYGIPVRVLLLTFVGTLMSFAFSLLFAIVGLLLVWKLQGIHPNMAIAYRRFALPGACCGGFMTFVVTLISEVGHYRRSRTLSAIEKMS